MNDHSGLVYPSTYKNIQDATAAHGFTMASDPLTGSLLCTLAASKPAGQFLELGTGTGLSTSWILAGMDADSSLISIDNDAACLDIAASHLPDTRLQIVCSDGGQWLADNRVQRFDYIFADTWHGKYLLLDETLSLLKRGGLYIIDDMLPQPNWPEGHHEKATQLLASLDAKPNLIITKLNWATGIVIAVKR